jgi:hypothetical protein
VPLLLRVTGVADLLVLSAAALAACAVIVPAVLRDVPEAAAATARTGAAAAAPEARPRLAGLLRDT